MSTTAKLWFLWSILTIAAGSVLVAGMFYGGPTRASLLIGETTSGHHQIELSCNTCHTSAFSTADDIDKTCKTCHGAELDAAKDSHPIKKFRDPRNADRLEKLAANKCVTCHTEHRPNVTNAMGVTLPNDYCALCHQDVGKNRPSHDGLAFNTCATAGCHNYHDNTALYEDFLEKHNDKPDLKENPISRHYKRDIEIETAGDPHILAAAANAPGEHGGDDKIVSSWLATAHAKGGVNCSGCHAPDQKTQTDISANWNAKPDHKVCATCHSMETATWLQGKHGMRLADKTQLETAGLFGLFRDKPLSPMQPKLARLPMSPNVAHAELTCNSCHQAHDYNTNTAQVSACVSCHTDEHTKAYEGSPHHKLWQAEQAGTGAKGSGVSCATCHMPRQWMEDASGYDEVLAANHNQNANLRPNEKMIRSVCMSCHGLGFSINSLADKDLINRNFDGRPSVHVESIEWVMKRVKERGAR